MTLSIRVQHLLGQLEQVRDHARVVQFQAYLKTDQPMLGVMSKPRKEALKQTIKRHPLNTQQEYLDFVDELWSHRYRELQYCAIDTAVRFKKYHNADSIKLFESMACSAKWWDLTDGIAVNLIGSILKHDRSYQSTLDNWSLDQDLWLRRTSLLAHLKHKDDMDMRTVSRTILTLTVDKQFFIQKAIGWILRERSRTDNAWVSEFIDRYRDDLSNLAIREASKYL